MLKLSVYDASRKSVDWKLPKQEIGNLYQHGALYYTAVINNYIGPSVYVVGYQYKDIVQATTRTWAY